ncbi:hypothetical protein CEXT_4261 [Caerostris extrusa]|uniref:Uncharacterized protein n=1 Tax=Caerostris extrusa TaxID=172846 RepID=A0AAV4NA74_CAEEX|nr:hypothetical protein CEXT_4261 [Caerostris extrusa]
MQWSFFFHNLSKLLLHKTSPDSLIRRVEIRIKSSLPPITDDFQGFDIPNTMQFKCSSSSDCGEVSATFDFGIGSGGGSCCWNPSVVDRVSDWKSSVLFY